MHPEGAQASEGARAIGSSREVLQLGRALGNRAQHGVAVGDGFVAWQTNGTGETFGGDNDYELVVGHQYVKYKGIASSRLLDVLGEATKDIWQSGVPLVPIVPARTNMELKPKTVVREQSGEFPIRW